ncbi:MAG: FAD-dependent oxidoreductase, partial [Candidatus Eisenbacteria bacterium]|nr:FAD-dependent oxidoreductase [Candidatus Eisenbacteria bacterium]
MREGGRLVVVGGVAAGMSAASRARRLRPDVEVVVFEKGGDVSYSACLLPYFVSGLVPSREKLVQYEADFFRNERHMDIQLNTPVTALDPVGRTVTFQKPDGGTDSLSFDALMLGTGAVAVKPPLPGIDIPGVATLRTLADGEHLRELVESGGVRNATIVGAGYIGLEMAEALAARDITVTVIELLPTVLPTFDPDMSELVERELLDKGVIVRKETSVEGFEPRDGSTELGYVRASGQRLEADLALVSVGVRPAVGLAAAAGVELGGTGAIKVDARQGTSEPFVLAAGECAEAAHV